MRQSTRRRQLDQGQHRWVTLPHGPFGPVEVDAPTAGQLAYGGVSTSGVTNAADGPRRDEAGRTAARP